MKRPICRAIVCVFGILLFASSSAAQNRAATAMTQDEIIALVHRRCATIIETAPFQDGLPFATFLELLEKQMPKEERLSFRLDREAFGKDADEILKNKVVLPPVPAKMVVNTALRIAWSQAYVAGYVVELKAGPGELVITTRDRSLYTVTYDIRDLLKHTRYLREQLKELKQMDRGDGDGVFFQGETREGIYDLRSDPDKADAWIARQIMASCGRERAGWRDRNPASTIQVRNGTKLVIHTPPSVHEQIAFMLDWFRTMIDVGVVMNAKLYAVDRAFYTKQIAPLFVNPKESTERRAVAKAPKELVKKLHGQKPILESDPDKLRPYESVSFLALQNTYQYLAGPGDAPPTTASHGVAFTVRPQVSTDRRCIRLELEQNAEQLLKISKRTLVDPKTGKIYDIETPRVKKTAAKAVIEIHDGHAIVMPVEYPAEDGKVFVLLAEPTIYIEWEEERLRKASIRPMPMADEEPEQELPDPPQVPIQPDPPPVELAKTEHVKQILQAVVLKLMTEPKLRRARDYNGTREDKKFALINGQHLAWPKTFQPVVPGQQLIVIDPEECKGFKQRLLGLRLDRFSLLRKEADGAEAVVEVEFHNAGGFVNGHANQSCLVTCRAKRVEKRWVVECKWCDFGGAEFEAK